jgi:hypothetical protein
MSHSDELGRLLSGLGKGQRKLVEELATELSAHSEGIRASLFTVAHRLDDRQVARLFNVAQVMAQPIVEKINADSQVLKPEFVAEFRARLQAHHATHTTQMDRLGFENAFLSASRAAGFDAAEAPSRTTRFYDATISDKRVALKTEGAKSMKADKLHISKLSEAAWIQDMRSARTRHKRSMEFVDSFLAAVDRIFMLRYYQASQVPHYELVEIPVSHFERIRELAPSDFESDSPRITISDEGGEIMEFRLDRSDSKITIGKIVKSRCVVHAEWRLAQGNEPL